MDSAAVQDTMTWRATIQQTFVNTVYEGVGRDVGEERVSGDAAHKVRGLRALRTAGQRRNGAVVLIYGEARQSSLPRCGH